MINPYENVNFSTCIPVISISHGHATNQDVFDRLYNGGCRHMALSNYRPSVPYYPLPYGSITEIENDAIACPNAEHFGWMKDCHFNGLGCTKSSGSSTSGWTSVTWKSAFDQILATQLYTDGGGITINHPAWTNRDQTNLSVEMAEQMLDYDSRVLGVEAISSYGKNTARGTTTWDSRDFWDSILLTGRRCWGFAVPDHDAEVGAEYGWTGEDWTGQIVLLLPAGTATTGETANHACLKAYRNGEFFCRVQQGEFAFTGISVSGQTISASTNTGTKLRFIEDGVATEYNGTSASHTVSGDSVYCRIEADDASGNLLLSQAITFKPYVQKKKISYNTALWTA